MPQHTKQKSLFSNEKTLSQIPALQELIALGYKYLSPKQALKLRGGKTANVLLENILHTQLHKQNQILYKGKEHPFSEAAIQEAIQKIKNPKSAGLQNTAAEIYDLITLGATIEQTIEGNKKSYNLKYIDWENPENNVFHVIPEFSVERSLSQQNARPDIVLFINGIPLAVIECKISSEKTRKAVSQTIRNQGDEYIPKLFNYVQLVMATNKNGTQYATVGTSAKFWSVWNEMEDKQEKIAELINTPLSDKQKDALFADEFKNEREHFDELERQGGRLLTAQDKAIYSLCRPERLLEISYRFTLFERGEKKIARYQQFFVVRETMKRIKNYDKDGRRQGGIIWHTQGSGKSLTMVMLLRALVLDKDIKNPRIILVTDRDDLDKQLGNTFAACGLSNERATSGRDLVKHLKDKTGIITTIMHKFGTALKAENYIDKSPNIFVLVDESHRTNFGELATRMRQMLPNSCYLGFTGTPLLQAQKNNFSKFGGLIEPHYSIKRAVDDGAVVPLLYEGRHVEIEQNKKAIDLWFDRYTSDLNEKQKANLKRKYARAETLNKTDRVIYMRTFDISEHYRANWQNTKYNFKAQLVAPSKAAALKYHKYLEEIGDVTSAVIISPPDTREGHEEVNKAPTDEVNQFWRDMMKKFGSEEAYNKQLIEQFKDEAKPEIMIVVDKLLTGFDAPRNTVLYLCRKRREHNLLQAIARVNRLHEGKEFGYIVDYAGVLGELDEALTMYEAFEGFEADDLIGALTSVNEEVQKLAARYSALWDIFKEVKNKKDEEEFELLLKDDELRGGFYERLTAYSKTLGIALSTVKFITETDETKLKTYKSDLKFFENLRKSVRLRYADAIDYGEHEPKIKKLLDTHIQAHEVTKLNDAVDILDDESFNELKQGQGIYSKKSTAARADIIAHATQKKITEKMDEDPAFYDKFSKLIEQAIADFRNNRISDIDYLNTVSDIRDKVFSKRRDDVPESINGNDEACAYYGIIKACLTGEQTGDSKDDVAIEVSLAIIGIIDKHWKVDFWRDDDARNVVINEIEDFLYEIKTKFAMDLSSAQMDEIIEKTIQIAKSRRPA